MTLPVMGSGLGAGRRSATRPTGTSSSTAGRRRSTGRWRPFWPPLADALPDAVIVHTERRDTTTWQRSAHGTIFQSANHDDRDFEEMWVAVADLTFDGHSTDPVVTGPGYERHNAPDEPYPHVNSTGEFRGRRRVDLETGEG